MGLRRLVEVRPGVWVARSRRYATATTVLLDGHGGALVIDPSWDADELGDIPRDLHDLEVECVAGLATHIHYDHVLWHPDLGNGPRWATPGTVHQSIESRTQVLAPLLGDLPDDLIAIAARLTPLAGPELEWRGPKAIVHEHNAHVEHHLALEVPDWGLLVAGDMLSDVELPYPDPDDAGLDAYRAGLDSLREVVLRTEIVVAGHGTTGYDVRERWDADRRYLDDVLTRGESDDPRIGLEDQAELHRSTCALAAQSTPHRGPAAATMGS